MSIKFPLTVCEYNDNDDRDIHLGYLTKSDVTKYVNMVKNRWSVEVNAIQALLPRENQATQYLEYIVYKMLRYGGITKRAIYIQSHTSVTTIFTYASAEGLLEELSDEHYKSDILEVLESGDIIDTYGESESVQDSFSEIAMGILWCKVLCIIGEIGEEGYNKWDDIGIIPMFVVISYTEVVYIDIGAINSFIPDEYTSSIISYLKTGFKTPLVEEPEESYTPIYLTPEPVYTPPPPRYTPPEPVYVPPPPPPLEVIPDPSEEELTYDLSGIEHQELIDELDNLTLGTGCPDNKVTHVPMYSIQYIVDSMYYSDNDIVSYFKSTGVPYDKYIKYITYILFSKSPQDFISTLGLSYNLTDTLRQAIEDPVKNGMLEIVWVNNQLESAVKSFCYFVILINLYKKGYKTALKYINDDMVKYDSGGLVDHMFNVTTYTYKDMYDNVTSYISNQSIDLSCINRVHGDETGDTTEEMMEYIQGSKTGGLHVLTYKFMVLQMDGENASFVYYNEDVFGVGTKAEDIRYMYTYRPGSVTLTKVKLVKDNKLPKRGIGMSMWLKMKLNIPDEPIPGIKCYLR